MPGCHLVFIQKSGSKYYKELQQNNIFQVKIRVLSKSVVDNNYTHNTGLFHKYSLNITKHSQTVILEDVDCDYQFTWCGNYHSFKNIEWSVIASEVQGLPETHVGL